MKPGINFVKTGEVQFCVWAPKAHQVSLILIHANSETCHSMKDRGDGFFEISVQIPESDTSYMYCLDGGKRLPDPRSSYQPFGVHGPSLLYNPQSFGWNDHDWKGIPLNEYIIYELHVGTFTPKGTFEAIIEKLPYLKKLGITAIELMPVAEFPGERNWGYDGVFPFAPHHAYGGPRGLQRLIDACHQEGLAVILDVVYNHFGPEGCYVGEFGYYFTERHKVPWGDAINYDGPHSNSVREFFIDNALYWLRNFHVDALRLDSADTIYDFSSSHFLEELNSKFKEEAFKIGRKAFLVVESAINETRFIDDYGLDAIWNDEFHHALQTLFTKSQWKYLTDYGKLSQLVQALVVGFVYDGQWSSYRKKKFGESSFSIPGHQLIAFIQNHDQVGNSAFGQRLGVLLQEERYLLASALLMCAPNIPLLFMGQEWNASTPFLYFTSFEDEVTAQGVKEGYLRFMEFAENNQPLPLDPQSMQPFFQSQLSWDEINQPSHARVLKYYQELISLRKNLKCLSNHRKDLTKVYYHDEGDWLILEREDPDGSQAVLIVNFLEEKQSISVPFPRGEWKLSLSSHPLPSADLTPETFALAQQEMRSIPLERWAALLYTSSNLIN